jgi:hypothetical protein
MSRNKKEVETVFSVMGVFVTIISNLIGLVKKFGGTMENIYRLATPEGKATLEKISQIIAGGIEVVQNEFLRPFNSEQNLIINRCDGSEIIAGSDELFNGIDSDFVNWGANERGVATSKTSVEMYELIKNATLAQMFGLISSDVNELCLTQHQIKNFIRKYRNWLWTDGCPVLVLFKSNNQFFVAHFKLYPNSYFCASLIRFGDDADYWNRCRIVVPKLAV